MSLIDHYYFLSEFLQAAIIAPAPPATHTPINPGINNGAPNTAAIPTPAAAPNRFIF